MPVRVRPTAPLLRIRRLLFVGIVAFCGIPVSGAVFEDYRTLRSIEPGEAAITVSGAVIDRDVFHLKLDHGTVTFLPAVAGRTIGAVFTGNGELDLEPSDPTERHHLALLSGSKTDGPLTIRFRAVVLLFGDETAAELKKAGTAAPADPGAREVWNRFRDRQRHKFRKNFDLALLAGLAEAPGTGGTFLAFPDDGDPLPAVVAFDPRGIGHLRLGIDVAGEQSALFVAGDKTRGFWYLAPAGSATGVADETDVHAASYTIETSVDSKLILHGTATVRIKASRAGLRLLPVSLAPKLRLTEAAVASASEAPPAWTKADFIQEKEDEDADAAVVPGAPLEAGREYLLRMSYSGKDVLFDAGDGNYSVGARESWYPNFGAFREPASFELTYRIPKDHDIVSVGDRTAEQIEGGEKVSRWKTSNPIRVAGFNYGRFRSLEQKDAESGLTIVVDTNPGTPDVINEINEALRGANDTRNIHGLGSPIADDPGNPMASTPNYVGPQSVTVDTQSLADSALVDGINTARVGAAYFGGLTEKRVAITQQSQWSFGQSWPGLIYLPYIAFLDRGVRHQLGLDDTRDFVDEVGPHEFAHQWWGHLVGWKNYRDLWLSEGFAEFTAGLVLEHTGGASRAQRFWENARKTILATPRGSAVSNDDAGPISLGWRLATFRNPEAYNAVVYKKGAYVLHMLQMAMRDHASKDSDRAFIDMMKDFVATWAGKNPSTADFQAMAEKHLIPTLNATHDGKLDWFFRQWVYGTEIPRYESKISVESSGGGKYRITGSVSQQGVSKNFRSLLPLYLDFGKGKIGRLGVVPMIGETAMPVSVEVALPAKPKAVVPNAMHDVLARD